MHCVLNMQEGIYLLHDRDARTVRAQYWVGTASYLTAGQEHLPIQRFQLNLERIK